MKTLNSTPKKDGFWMPAEFGPHRGSWLLWPVRPDNWRLNAAPAKKEFSRLVSKMSEFESVTVGVLPAEYDRAVEMLPPTVNIRRLEYDDIWIRDTGPTCVINGNGEVRGIDWEFNSWGGLFNSWEMDNQVATKVLEFENFDRYKSNLTLEGGAIHVDGEGTLLTTEECILNSNRNTGVNKSDVERELKEYLNVSKIIWLPRGLHMDETGGHIDSLCCFVRPGEVVLAWTDDRSDPQYEISSEALDVLRKSTDARGRSLQVHKLYLPKPLFISREESEGFEKTLGTISRKEGDKLAPSYVNFYTPNGGVIVPAFDDPNDEPARQMLEKIFPERIVSSIPSREILLGGGGIHCVVQQVP